MARPRTATVQERGVKEPFSPHVLRRSPGRLRVHVPSLASEGDAGLSRIGAYAGVLGARCNERTANVLIEFDCALIDEPSLLALIASGPGQARAGSARQSPAPPAPECSQEARWLRARRTETIAAKPADCVAALLEFEHYPDWQAHVTSVTVLERDQRGRGSRVQTCGKVGEREIQFSASYRFPSPEPHRLRATRRIARGATGYLGVSKHRQRAHARHLRAGGQAGMATAPHASGSSVRPDPRRDSRPCHGRVART